MSPASSPGSSSLWRQLLQNARGQGDLKQLAGMLALLTFLACCVLAARSPAGMSDAMVLTLGAVIILWWVGDTTEAVAVLMALYGKWRTPETQINADQATIESQTTTIIPPATSPDTSPLTSPANPEEQEA